MSARRSTRSASKFTPVSSQEEPQSVTKSPTSKKNVTTPVPINLNTSVAPAAGTRRSSRRSSAYGDEFETSATSVNTTHRDMSIMLDDEVINTSTLKTPASSKTISSSKKSTSKAVDSSSAVKASSNQSSAIGAKITNNISNLNVSSSSAVSAPVHINANNSNNISVISAMNSSVNMSSHDVSQIFSEKEKESANTSFNISSSSIPPKEIKDFERKYSSKFAAVIVKDLLEKHNSSGSDQENEKVQQMVSLILYGD